MKNEKVVTGLTWARITEIENHVNKRADEIHKQAVRLGEMFGRDNRPSPHQPADYFLEPVIKAHKALYAETAKDLGLVYKDMLSLREQLKEKGRLLAVSRVDQAKVKNDLKDELDALPLPFSDNLVPNCYSALIVIYGADLVLNSLAFQMAAPNFVAALGMAVGVTSAQIIAAHQLHKKSAEITSDKKTWIEPLLYMAGLTACFMIAGMLREDWLKLEEKSNHVPLWAFIVFNWLFTIAASLVLKVMPSKEKIAEKEKYVQLQAKVEEVENKLDEVDADIAKNNDLRANAEVNINEFPSYETAMQNKILSNAEYSKAQFESTNLLYRTDGHGVFSYSEKNNNLNN
jgi:hypothetical protein